MANIKSNKKRNEQNQKRHALKRAYLSSMKTQIKKTRKSCNIQDLNKAYSLISKANAKGMIKRNKANRLKSRLALSINKTQ